MKDHQRFPRSLSDAFPDERAASFEPPPRRRGWKRLALRLLALLALGVQLAYIVYWIAS
jgi:hypothetical protein